MDKDKWRKWLGYMVAVPMVLCVVVFVVVSIIYVKQHRQYKQQQQAVCQIYTAKKSHTVPNTVSNTVQDQCDNYAGIQPRSLLKQQGFMLEPTQKGRQNCYLTHNHTAYTRMGIDRAKLSGFQGAGVTLGLVDIGAVFTHGEVKKQLLPAAPQQSQIKPRLHSTQVAAAAVGSTVGVASQAKLLVKALPQTLRSTDATSDLVYAETAALLHKQPNLVQSVIQRLFGKLLHLFGSQTLPKNPNTAAIIIEPNDIGYNLLFYPTQNTAKFTNLSSLFHKLIQHDSVLVLAAGNQGKDIAAQFQAQSGDDFKFTLANKGIAEKLIYVGSFDTRTNSLAGYSNYPGQLLALQQRFMVVADGLNLAGLEPQKLTPPIKGTSFAAPVLAGAMAILMQIDPKLTAVQAANILLKTANKDFPEYKQSCAIDINPANTNTAKKHTNCGKLKYGQGLLNLSAAIDVVLENRCADD